MSQKTFNLTVPDSKRQTSQGMPLMRQRVITFNRSQNHFVIFASHCNYYLKISSFRYRMTKSTPIAKTQALLWRSKNSFAYFILIVTTVHWRSLLTVRGILFDQNFCFSSCVGKEHEAHILARLLLLLKLLHAKCHVIYEHCTRVYQKVPRLDLQTRMYVPDLSLGSIPFKIVSLCSDTPIPAPLPLLERVLEVLFSKLTNF